MLIPTPIFNKRGGIVLTLVETSVAFGGPIPLPTGSIAGDLFVYANFSGNTFSGIPSKVTPSGSPVELFDITNGFHRATGFIGKLTSTHISDGQFTTMAGDFCQHSIMTTFRPSKPITTVSKNTWGHQITSDTPSDQTITSVGEVKTHVAALFNMAGMVSNTVSGALFDPWTGEDAWDGDTWANMAWRINNPGESRANITTKVGDSGILTLAASGLAIVE